MQSSRLKVIVIMLASVLALVLSLTFALRLWLDKKYQSVAFTSSLEEGIKLLSPNSNLQVKVSAGSLSGLFGVTLPEIKITSSENSGAEMVLRNTVFMPDLVLTAITRRLPFSLKLVPQTGESLLLEATLHFNWKMTEFKIQPANLTLVNLNTQTISSALKAFNYSRKASKVLLAFNGRLNGTAKLESLNPLNPSTGSGSTALIFTQGQFSLPQFTNLNLEATPLKIRWANDNMNTVEPWQLSTTVLGQKIQTDISLDAAFGRSLTNQGIEINKIGFDIDATGPLMALAAIGRLLNCKIPGTGSLAEAINPLPKKINFYVSSNDRHKEMTCTTNGGG